MDTDLVKQLHRIEHKLNALLQHFLVQDNLEPPTKMDEPRICIGCGQEITWQPSHNGYPVTLCGCVTPIGAVDFNKYAPPTK